MPSHLHSCRIIVVFLRIIAMNLVDRNVLTILEELCEIDLNISQYCFGIIIIIAATVAGKIQGLYILFSGVWVMLPVNLWVLFPHPAPGRPSSKLAPSTASLDSLRAAALQGFWQPCSHVARRCLKRSISKTWQYQKPNLDWVANHANVCVVRLCPFSLVSHLPRRCNQVARPQGIRNILRPIQFYLASFQSITSITGPLQLRLVLWCCVKACCKRYDFLSPNPRCPCILTIPLQQTPMDAKNHEWKKYHKSCLKLKKA